MTKKIVWLFLLPILFSTTVSSCKKKGCTDSAAKNYCDECEKDDGSCTYATASDYAGTWSVSSSCGSAYSMTITASGSNLTLSKLQNCFTVTATVSGNTLTIPTQTMTASTSTCGNPYTISGTGTLSGSSSNSLSISYSVKDISGITTNCTATCTK